MAEIAARLPLDGRMHAGNGVRLEPLPHAERFILRAGADAVPAIETALGLQLPKRPKTSAAANGITALWLGPDEWLVFGDEGAGFGEKFGGLQQVPLSVVDISHRNVAIAVSGPNAAIALNSGCPLDLRLPAFPVGAATRTILGKAEIVLLREAEERFRVECWRSFADYVWKFLVVAAKSA